MILQQLDLKDKSVPQEFNPALTSLPEDTSFKNILYRKLFPESMEEIPTKTPDIKSNLETFQIINNLKLHFEKELTLEELEQSIFLNIITNFSKNEKVKSIYYQKYRGEIQVYILISTSQYDNDLMDILLGIEYDIRKKYPGIIFEFFYPPAAISDKEDFIHPRANCIFSR